MPGSRHVTLVNLYFHRKHLVFLFIFVTLPSTTRKIFKTFIEGKLQIFSKPALTVFLMLKIKKKLLCFWKSFPAVTPPSLHHKPGEVAAQRLDMRDCQWWK